jgi:peptidyl-prolyl cis-trans isomerase SurA
MLRHLIAVLVLVSALGVGTSCRAQEMDRVAAVVNDEAISLIDVLARVRLALVSANMPDSTENRQRVLPQVIRKMIDERLQLQEAGRLKISISTADIDAGVGMIEQQNRMPKGTLVQTLTRQGVDPVAVREQIRADLTWMRLVTRALQPQVRIGEEEISDRFEAMRVNQGRTENLLAEIYLPVDSAAAEGEAQRLGERLVEQLKVGTPFAALARQFSRAPSAANGGTMGWMTEGSLDDEIQDIVTKLNKGQVSPLTRTSSGFHILAFIDQRIAGQTIDPEAAVVSYARIVLPIPRGPGAPPKQQLLGQAGNLTGSARSCADLDTTGHRLGATKVERFGPLKLAELNAEARHILAPLPVNRVSSPSETPDGIQVMMLCTREDSTKVVGLTREQVRRIIEDERIDMLTRRYMRDLRRQAFIDIRL